MRWPVIFLALACVGVFALRLFIAFSAEGFAGDEAYFHLRQIEHIRSTGLPLFEDPLSYGGRAYFFSPLFHYVVAGSSFLFPVEAAGKIIPNLFAVLVMLLVYGIAFRVAKHEGVAVFTAVFSAFVPVWFGQTISTLSPATLGVLLLFFVVYAWLRSNEVRWRFLYLAGLLLFAFVHPIVLVFVLGLVLYLLLVLVERLRVEQAELEMALFSIVFVLWSQFLLYKKFILAHGPAVVWQNIPPGLLSSLFSDITVLTALYQIGILPVLYGVFVAYRYVFRRKNRMAYFMISFALAAGIVLWFRLVPLRLGLVLLGLFLMVLFSKWVKFFLDYIPTTRFPRWKFAFVFSLIMVFVLTSVIPSLGEAYAMQRQAPSQGMLRAFGWIRANTGSDAVVVAGVDEGHRVAALMGRKNVVDTHFLLQRDARQRVHDVNRIFTTPLGVEAIQLMDRYGASVIMLSPGTRRSLKIDGLAYAEPSRCFARTFSEEGYVVFIKHGFCQVEVS